MLQAHTVDVNLVAGVEPAGRNQQEHVSLKIDLR